MRQILQEEGILNMDDNSQKGKGKERQTWNIDVNNSFEWHVNDSQVSICWIYFG
jgi:hypothetical protein